LKRTLLSVALERHHYVLAAHILVYGLIKASLKMTENSHGSQKRYGRKRRKQEKD